MALMLKRQRDGTLRGEWYGVYTDSNGKRKVANLNVKVDGTPHPSLSMRKSGSPAFETSRALAIKALEEHVENEQRKGRVDHLTERLIEAKTGHKLEYVRIGELKDRWRGLGREVAATEEHLQNCDAHFSRFVTFMQGQNDAANFLYEVTAKDAAAFVKDVRSKLAPATAHYCVRLIAKAFSRFLPIGAMNPFAEFVGRRKNLTSGVVHRQPFTQDELRKLLEVASDDKFMYPLIVTAACSGMRRGDVCELKWSAVDLQGGMLKVKTSKTDAAVEIPIFGPLRAVLEGRKGDGQGYVFPEAAAMMQKNADGLSYRFKKIVAQALDTGALPPLPPTVPASEVATEALAAVEAHVADAELRKRLLDNFQRYAAGDSFRKIGHATGQSRGMVSHDLERIERWTGKRFVRSTPGRHTKGEQHDIKSAIARVTRVTRERGQLAASVRDWHALRTTFVTLALSAGVPMELVRRVTGHATVEVVLKHYFRPDRDQFKAALSGAMPKVLTGRAKRMRPVDEHAALATKLAAGTATAKDKARMLELAEKLCQ